MHVSHNSVARERGKWGLAWKTRDPEDVGVQGNPEAVDHGIGQLLLAVPVSAGNLVSVVREG